MGFCVVPLVIADNSIEERAVKSHEQSQLTEGR